MAWVSIKCPHCGCEEKITVNASVSHGFSHTYCRKCHKKYAIKTSFGNVSVIKE